MQPSAGHQLKRGRAKNSFAAVTIVIDALHGDTWH